MIAHSNNQMAANYPINVQHPPNYLNPSFSPQAAPVRPAYEDFLRQVSAAIPGVDIEELLRQITTNPTQPIQIAVPSGVNTSAVQQHLQHSLETSMLQALNGLNTPRAPPPNNSLYDDLIKEHYAHAFEPPKRPQPPPPPPSEDEMAKQDQDADANQDEEYREVETYSDYMPAKLTYGLPHPDPVVETSSLATVEPPDIHYKLKLPPKVIDNGLLSALQLESVIYASQQHSHFLADRRTRRGFLIGDGAGVGKGRTIAGIIYENFLNGRRKSIWLSVSTDLKLDAERDLKDIGAKIPVYLLGKFTYGRRINVDSGVIFTTYSGLVSKSQSLKGVLGSRMGQLTSWVGSDFDGVLVFDECHKAKNISMTKNKKTQSKAAEFAVEIQKRLPKARVVYASATGASETKHLGYMVRLGIWGEGTPFETFSDFCGAIEKRGVGAMELVAVDLKMRGSYIARQLSFKTTSFEILTAPLDEPFINLYDECVDMWAKALSLFVQASDIVGDKRRSRTMWATFWAAHQKFFKYLCIGTKVPIVIQIAKAALENGKSVVIGLQSTGESKTMEALEDGDISEFISTARATFESLVENHFPVPHKCKRARPRNHISNNCDKSPSASSNVSANPSSSSVSTIDENWAGNDPVKFVVEDGVIKTQLQADKGDFKPKKMRKPLTKRFAKNQQALDELAKEKQNKMEKRSGRAVRAKRRALQRDSRKSRIKLPEDDSDTEISTIFSSSSSETQLKDGDDSDETYSESEDCDSSTITDCVSEPESVISNQDLKVRQSSSTNCAKREVLNSDSDSDIQITAVKPRRNYEVIILSTDEEDEDEEPPNADDPLIKHGKKLTEMRDELFKMIDNLGPRLPNNTLDELIDRLGGPSKVAEMTGRKGRVLKDEEGLVSYRQRNEEDALENLNILEKERFMNGEKFIAIISEAASSGISLQADKRVANKRRRVHITIELPWSADRAIQQFGRTHRSNQTSGPEYVFVISELAGEKRFASIVAKRLESLGALTHGDRRATTESRDLSQFNIVGRYCKQALELLCRYVECGMKFANIMPEYQHGDFLKDARDAFVGSGLARYTGHLFIPDPHSTQINHFLNRLLGMKVHVQNALFKLFTDYMDRVIARKKAAGQYDAGILELNSESGKTRCDSPEDFYLKTLTGPVKCTLRNVRVERGISWQEALKLLEDSDGDTRAGFYLSVNPLTKAKMIFLLLRELNAVDLFRCYKPNTGRQSKPNYFSLLSEKGEKCSLAKAEKVWTSIFDATDTKCVHLCFFDSCKRKQAKLNCDVGLRHRKYCILSGGILTAWPYLEMKAPEVTAHLQIVRLKLDASNRVIGKHRGGSLGRTER